eukprot:6185296-Pleurochrysis_carterae.AAC.1
MIQLWKAYNAQPALWPPHSVCCAACCVMNTVASDALRASKQARACSACMHELTHACTMHAACMHAQCMLVRYLHCVCASSSILALARKLAL